MEWQNGRLQEENTRLQLFRRVSDLNKVKVEWHRMLWAPFTVPKFVLIAWITILNRLPTMDRLQAWGMEVTDICVSCKQGKESRNHLFFCCDYSKHI